MPRYLPVCLAAALAMATIGPTAQSHALFTFHSNAWLNLHHFVRASARRGPGPSGLSPEENRQWLAGVEFYKSYAQRDLLDDEMHEIKSALRRAEGQPSLEGIAIAADLKATLERLMPIYQKYWWSEHDAANSAWIRVAEPLVDRHGMALSRAITRAYGTSWPSDPVPVDLSVTAGPNGAYTTGPPTHVTISSSDRGYQGLAALEMLFHESSHSAISDLFPRVEQASREQKVVVPRGLWHAVLFYTAGELTTRELKAHGITYTQYAGKDLYANLCGPDCHEKIATRWTPRLNGQQSVADALSALVTSFR